MRNAPWFALVAARQWQVRLVLLVWTLYVPCFLRCRQAQDARHHGRYDQKESYAATLWPHSRRLGNGMCMVGSAAMMQYALCSQRLSAGSLPGVLTASCGRQFVHGVRAVGYRNVAGTGSWTTPSTEAATVPSATKGTCKTSSCTVGLAQGCVMVQTCSPTACRSSFRVCLVGVMTASCGLRLGHGVLAVGHGAVAGTGWSRCFRAVCTGTRPEGHVHRDMDSP